MPVLIYVKMLNGRVSLTRKLKFTNAWILTSFAWVDFIYFVM